MSVVLTNYVVEIPLVIVYPLAACNFNKNETNTF